MLATCERGLAEIAVETQVVRCGKIGKMDVLDTRFDWETVSESHCC